MEVSRKPSWLRAKVPSGPGYQAVRQLVDANRLHTVCQSAQCPNLGECWSRGTATLMILGNICTRSCNFCAIATGRPTELDLGEPALRTVAMPADTNASGDIFGGWILSQMDLAGGVVAERRAGGRVAVTA